ncbi:MAG: helix-turn-helix domain-containing protein [bacterium]
MERFLNINQLAELLSVKTSTIYGWIHEERIPYYKVVGLVRFKEKEVSEWLDKRHCKGRLRRVVDIEVG